MNILYVTYKDPRVKDGGNELRTHLLWEALKKKGKVYTLVFNFLQNDQVIYQETDNPICFYNPKISRHYLNRIAYQIITKISGLPVLPFVKFTPKRLPEFFEGISFDIIVGRYVHSLQFYHLWEYAPTYIDIDDHPTQVYETLIQHQLPFVLRPLGRWVNKIQFKNIQKNISGGWIANQEQQALCDNHIRHLPNIPIIPSDNYNPVSDRYEYLLTIGVMSYAPNYLGVDTFLKEIWPNFHSKYPNIKYLIGGKGVPESYRTKWAAIEGVKYIGYIDDLNMAYEKCAAVVVPIYTGGGTCIKTLEALAYSRICFSTPFGVRGISGDIDLEDKGLFVFESDSEFISKYKQMQNSEERNIMEMKGKEFIYKYFSKESFECAVNSIIDI